MSTCFVQLGRYGDVMNMLPLVWEASRIGPKPSLLVGKDFADLLDGVSYCTPVIWNGDWTDLQGAMKFAETHFDTIYCTQIYSKNYPHKRDTESFTKESWAQIGRRDWGTLPLVFDLRSSSREAMLKVYGVPRPMILVATNANSSPFSRANELQCDLFERFGKTHQIIPLDYPVTSLCDLLGIFEEAKCLVTVDTAHLHLAHASKIPVVALIADKPSLWHGSAELPGQRYRCRYSDYPQKRSELLDAVAEAMKPKAPRRLIHVYCDYERDEDGTRRHAIAKGTWVREYAAGDGSSWVEGRFYMHPDGLDVRTSILIGDPKPVPFVNDIVSRVLKSANSDDFIVLTNDDISFAPGLTETLLNLRAPCGWSHRYDFSKIDRPVTTVGLSVGLKYPGADFFAFKADWWKAQKFPDFYLGRQRWDLCVMSAMMLSGGVELPIAIAHEQHPSFWRTGNNENTNPANRFNYAAAAKWHAERGIPMQ